MYEKLNPSQISSTTNPFVEEEITSNQVQRRTMNLPEPISINDVDSTQDQLIEDGYDMISEDSIQIDSRDETDHCKKRITYSRNQLVDIYRSLADSECPEWIANNQNFPKRAEESGENYLSNLVEKDLKFIFDWWSHKSTADGVKKKELAVNERDKRNEHFDSGNNQNSGNNFRLNLNRPGQENGGDRGGINKEFNKNPSYNSNYNSNNGFNTHPSNNNFKNNNPTKFSERQPFNSNYRNQPDRNQPDRNQPDRVDVRNSNENRLVDDRTDARGFLRSRGENLNQNFASFRRFPNRNQPDRFNNFGSGSNQRHGRDTEPEWFTEGPISQHDTIELKGFDDDDGGEEKSNASKNIGMSSGMNEQQQINKSSPLHQQHQSLPQAQKPQQPPQQPPQQSKIFAPSNKFDPFHETDFKKLPADWQVAIENQANSSRFAKFFNEPDHYLSPTAMAQPLDNSATEEQIEKLFSSARNVNVNQNATNQPQFNQQQSQQQQINLQNDFFGNLMNCNLPPRQQQHQQSLQQLIDNRMHSQHNYPNSETVEAMNQQLNSKKTEQQLIDILQKARINVNSLIAQQNALHKDNLIKGQVKSAEELEAGLLSNGSPPARKSNIHHQHTNQQHPAHQSHQVNPADLFQNLCLNNNNKYEMSDAQLSMKQAQEDNRAINPFVLNLLDDAQKQKTIGPVLSPMHQQMHQQMNEQINQQMHQQINHPMNQHLNQQMNQAISNSMMKNQMNSRSNYQPNNMMFGTQQVEVKREEKVNPFMPTSVIRKIAKEKNSLGGNRGMSEANFETVTGNHINDRSVGGARGREIEQKGNLGSNYAMTQAGLMQQNFAITTGNRWPDNSIQQHSIDSTTPNHQNQADQQEALRNLLVRASKKQPQQQVDPNALLNNFASSKNIGHNLTHYAKVVQNDGQKKLIEILQKASTNFGKTAATDSTGNKINDWFELEMQRNNNHLSPIIKENAFTLEDIENN